MIDSADVNMIARRIKIVLITFLLLNLAFLFGNAYFACEFEHSTDPAAAIPTKAPVAPVTTYSDAFVIGANKVKLVSRYRSSGEAWEVVLKVDTDGSVFVVTIEDHDERQNVGRGWRHRVVKDGRESWRLTEGWSERWRSPPEESR